MSSIKLGNMDMALLDKQRLQLAALLMTHGERFTAQEEDALVGIQNMLDAISDRHLVETELRNGPYITQAADMYCNDDIEIDDEESVHFSEAELGTWVSAWVWVPFDNEDEEDE